MPDLTIQVQEVKGLSGTALVILNGSIDAKTVITFQTHLNSVKERGVERFIMDMENVKYVNSTGLGYLINLSDSVTPDKGGGYACGRREKRRLIATTPARTGSATAVPTSHGAPAPPAAASWDRAETPAPAARGPPVPSEQSGPPAPGP